MTSTSTHDPFHRHDETSFGDTTPLIGGWDRTQASIELEKTDEAWNRIREKYPNINPVKSPFTATLQGPRSGPKSGGLTTEGGYQLGGSGCIPPRKILQF